MTAVRNDKSESPGRGKAKASCQCPFCDSPMEATYPFCKACGREIRRCSKCGRVLAPHEKFCPNCK